MCALGKIAACEVSFIPIASNSYAADVNRVIEIIERSGLNYSVGAMSTIIWGSSNEIFDLLSEIYTSMSETCSFEIIAKLSNICGCTG